jgi:hypothetical protein
MVNVSDKIIHIGEHAVPIPQPKSKDEILFFNDKDPVWNRDSLIEDYRDIWFSFIPYHTRLDQTATLYDQDNILISLNKDDSDYIRRIYEQEMHRRIYGVHFKNKDEITWITGDHYYALMWCKTQRHDGRGDYFDYREFQSHYFFLHYSSGLVLSIHWWGILVKG